MTRQSPTCKWTDAIVLNNQNQQEWNIDILSKTVHGFHSKTSKANFLGWLIQSHVSHAWHVEDDAYLHSSHPSAISAAYENSTADIVALNWTHQTGGWMERTCTVCNRTNVAKFAWPIARISRRLAWEVMQRTIKGARGHHEVLVGTICRQTPWCRMDLREHPFIGHVRAVGGGKGKKYLVNNWTSVHVGKVYHPVQCRV